MRNYVVPNWPHHLFHSVRRDYRQLVLKYPAERPSIDKGLKLRPEHRLRVEIISLV